MEFKPEPINDEALAWVNEVRERMGRPTLAEMPARDPDEPRQQYANPVAQALGYPVYRHQEWPTVYTNVRTRTEAETIGRSRPWTGRIESYEVLLPAFMWEHAA